MRSKQAKDSKEFRFADQPGLEAVASHGRNLVERLRKKSASPASEKVLKIRFSVTEAAHLLGCSPNRIRAAEADGRLSSKPLNDPTSRRASYSVEDLQSMRQILGGSPARLPTETAAIIAVQNFKGGVAKSTTSVNLAHKLAIKGYRVLVVDCDSQATTTMMFGFNPYLQITQSETLYPFLALEIEQNDLNYAVKRTHWPNIDLIPSCLELFDVEYELAAVGSGGGNILGDRFSRLRRGLKDLSQNYDVIILDPPPALGTVSLAVMQAANALLIPLTPSLPDFVSTVQFISKMTNVLDELNDFGIDVSYDFVRLICSRHNTNDPSQAAILSLMESAFGSLLLPIKILDSSEIGNASLRMLSIYELDEPIGSPRTYKRCRDNVDAALDQVEALIRARWDSFRVEEVADVA